MSYEHISIFITYLSHENGFNQQTYPLIVSETIVALTKKLHLNFIHVAWEVELFKFIYCLIFGRKDFKPEILIQQLH